MNVEEILKLIDTRMGDFDILIEAATRNPAMKDNVEALQYAKNELLLLRDTIKSSSKPAESEV